MNTCVALTQVVSYSHVHLSTYDVLIGLGAQFKYNYILECRILSRYNK